MITLFDGESSLRSLRLENLSEESQTYKLANTQLDQYQAWNKELDELKAEAKTLQQQVGFEAVKAYRAKIVALVGNRSST
jgi:cell shape-determining protein MreC